LGGHRSLLCDVDLRQHGAGADRANGGGWSRERQCWDDHFVARADAHRPQREFQRSRSVADGNNVSAD